MPNIEITNMVMVEDEKNGRAVVIDRVKKYPGICFPGGHAEPGESVYESAVREIKEETGLDIKDLEFRGVIHWYNKNNGDWYIEYFYRTKSFSGTLSAGTDEGRVFWADTDKIPGMKLSPNFDSYLRLIYDDSITEGYCAYTDDMDAKNIKFY